MITLQDNIDVRPVKIEWYWSEKKSDTRDRLLAEIDPHYIITGTTAVYEWETVEW